jgi:hypothetical protein
MINVVGVVLALAIAGAAGWLTRRRGDVLDYHRTDTAANRVGRGWLWSRHGGR